ncbi:MAG: hypothetical protein HC767_05565 [Akkermansiaceae bacterium]|nr:hypothetical protein [Akkermansiaceae bacterium]
MEIVCSSLLLSSQYELLLVCQHQLYDVRSYLVEPIRYRKVVVEMMGSGANSGPNDSKPHINLNRDQEMAISAAVETFEKRCDEIWKMRENLCEQVKQTRVSRGSELENMRSFIQVRCSLHAATLPVLATTSTPHHCCPMILPSVVYWGGRHAAMLFACAQITVGAVQVHGHMETLQESLRAENEVLVRFLGDVGRILGPAPLTHALFASGGQDIFTYCQAIHCRALMVNSSSLGSGQSTPHPTAAHLAHLVACRGCLQHPRLRRGCRGGMARAVQP